MKPTNKCKYHKYNKDNYEHICTARECCCKGNKTDQKDCLIAQLENRCEKYKQALINIEKLVSKWYENEVIQYQSDYDEFLAIINKVKDGNNVKTNS